MAFDVLALLLGCLGLGAAAARWGRLPTGTVAVVNGWVLYVALPALVLVQVARLDPAPELMFAALAPWMVIGGTLALFPALGRGLGWDRGTVGALVLTCGLGNTAFLGLPLIRALRGESALGTAVIADQFGSFLALSTVGIWVAARGAGQSVRAMDLAWRVLRFPAFAAVLVAVVVRTAGGWPGWVEGALLRVGDTLTPLALFSVGLQFRLTHLGMQRAAMATGLSWKLVLAPGLVWGVALLLGTPRAIADIAVLQCAMAPMISAGILAQQHGLNPPLANSVVGVGILLSLATVPAWNAVLG